MINEDKLIEKMRQTIIDSCGVQPKTLGWRDENEARKWIIKQDDQILFTTKDKEIHNEC